MSGRLTARIVLCLAAGVLAWGPCDADAQTSSAGNRVPPLADAPAAPASGLSEVLPSRPIHGTSFGPEQLRTLPQSGSIWSLIETADAMVVVDRIDNGGLYLGDARQFGSYGSSWTQVSFSMDGLDTTDPDRTGTPLLYVDPQSLDGISVSSVLRRLDFAGTGPSVRLVPRRPFDTWRGGVQASLVPHGLQADDSQPPAVPIAHFGSATDASLIAGGPVIPQRFSVFLSGRLASSRRFERSDPTELDSRVVSSFLHGVFTPSPGNVLRLVGSIDGTRHPFEGRARYADRGVTAGDTFYHLHGTWESVASGSASWSAVAGFQRGVFSGPGEDPSSPVVGTVERLRDGPIPDLLAPDKEIHQRLDAALRFQWSPGGSAGPHLVSGGFSVSRQSGTTAAIAPAVIGELVDGLPARVWRYSFAGPEERRATDLAGWAAGHLALSSRLALDAAVRFESTQGWLDGADAAISWTTLLPRAALRWNMAEDGTVQMFFGYGAQRSRLPLGYLAYADPGGLSGEVFRWNDLNRDRVVQSREYGRLISVVGPGGGTGSIDPSLAPPVAREVIVGFEAKFGTHWRGRISGIDRHQADLVAPVDVGVTSGDYNTVRLWDQGQDWVNPQDDGWLEVYNRKVSSFGKDRYLLTNPAGNDGRYVGIDLALERLFDGRWFMLLGASAHRSDGYGGNRGFLVSENDNAVLGEAFTDPNALTHDRGRLFFDRGYVIKWSAGRVFAARDVSLGAVARYQDGQHFSRLVIVPDLNQGPEAVQTYTRGISRFMYTFTLDARVEKGVRFGARRAALVAEVFNLLNTGNEVEEDPVTTHLFRATTAVQPPRAVRLGLKLEF